MMALVKTDNTIILMRGRFGGVYFKKDPSGQHVQAMPRHVLSAHSLLLGFGVDAFTTMAAIWGMVLLGVMSAAWGAFALLYLFTDKRGEEKRIPGYCWYIHYAMMFPEKENPPFWKPPHAPGELPDYYAVFKGMWMYEHTPDEWPIDCPADYYWPGLTWNGRPSYRNDDITWFIWWKDPNWVVSIGLGYEDPPTTFYSKASAINDYYYNPVTHNWIHVYAGKRGK